MSIATSHVRFIKPCWATASLVCVIAALCSDERLGTEVRTGTAPLAVEFERIDVACRGDFSQGDPWELSLRSDGSAVETVFVGGKRIVRALDLPLETVARIRVSLTENEFEALPRELGRIVLSGSVRTVASTKGAEVKIVSMQHADDSAFPDKHDKERAKRFFRVWSTLEGCIGSSDAHRAAAIDSAILRGWGLR